MRAHRRPACLLLGIAVAVLCASLGSAPAAVAATTFSNTTSIGLQDAGGFNGGIGPAPATLYPSPITVSGLTGTISSVTVSLSGIHYLYSQDIGALLVGPGGEALSLFTAVGSNDQSSATNGLDVTLDDAATATYPYNTALPTTGS